MNFVFLGLSLFAGFMLANQNPINADMKKVVGSPFISAAISFLVGSVFASVLSVPQIGAGLTITMGLIGQIVGSMLVQQFGWWRSAKISVSRIQILGVVVMAAGVVFIKFL